MSAPLALIEDVPGGGTPIVAIRGELDVDTTPALREWLMRASESGRCSVAIDLAHVSFMAVSGVHALCESAAELARTGAHLTIVCAEPRTLRLFDICRVGDVLDVVGDRASIPPASAPDHDRTVKLEAWLDRYAAGSSPSA